MLSNLSLRPVSVKSKFCLVKTGLWPEVLKRTTPHARFECMPGFLRSDHFCQVPVKGTIPIALANQLGKICPESPHSCNTATCATKF